MESNFEWYQLVVGYAIGIVMAFGWYRICKELNNWFGINHYILTIMYVISGFIGIELMAVPNPEAEKVETSIWIEMWDMLTTVPLDLGLNIIVLMVMFTLFAMLPFMGLMVLTVFYKWLRNPNLFNEIEDKENNN